MRLGPVPLDPSALMSAAKARGVPLHVETIPDPAVAALYERPFVLVRPDGHVAWRGGAVPSDALEIIDRVRGAQGGSGTLAS